MRDDFLEADCTCICGDLMLDPYVTSAGSSYHKACIEKWFDEGRLTDPLTQLPVSPTLYPNHALKKIVHNYRDHLIKQLAAGYQGAETEEEVARRLSKQKYVGWFVSFKATLGFFSRHLEEDLLYLSEKETKKICLHLSQDIQAQRAALRSKQQEIDGLQKQTDLNIESDQFEENEPIFDRIAVLQEERKALQKEIESLSERLEPAKETFVKMMDDRFQRHSDILSKISFFRSQKNEARKDVRFFKSQNKVPPQSGGSVSSASTSSLPLGRTEQARQLLTDYFAGELSFEVRGEKFAGSAKREKVLIVTPVDQRQKIIFSDFMKGGAFFMKDEPIGVGQFMLMVYRIDLEKLQECCLKNKTISMRV